MARKKAVNLIRCTRVFINASSTKEKYRVSQQDFTRLRKLSFEVLVLSMLKLFRRSLPMEIHSLFSDLNIYLKKVTASAFVQSRKKIKPELFYDLHRLIVREYYTDNDETVKLYKGMRILSIDGSSIHLPLTPAILAQYGVCNNQKKTDDVVIARVSVLYDVLNEIVLDGLLRPFAEGEVPLSRKHFDYMAPGDLVIMDRAYPSFESAFLLQQKGVHFLFRCKEVFSNQVKAFVASGKRDEIIEIKAKQNKSFKDLPYEQNSTIKVRLLRITLANGVTQVLMTSLLDRKAFTYDEFKSLYYMRWKVETFYDRFKNIIGVEHFSGTSEQFIQQEFNCALYMSNLQTILTQEARQEAEEKYENRTYEYKINRSLSFGFIREKLLMLYTTENDDEKIVQELKTLFIQNVIPVRPGRKNIRDVDKYRQRTEPKQFKNRRIIL